MTKIEPIIIDRNTHEILTGYTIRSEAQIRASRDYLELKDGRRDGAQFIFNVMSNVPYVSSVLTAAQCGYLLVLSTYIDWDGRLIRSQKDKVSLTNSDIMSLLRIKERTFYDFMSACKNYGFITQDDSDYHICSDISVKGTPSTNAVVRSYITTLREMATENKPEHIGILYKLFPYVSKYTNMLVENPEESNRKKRHKLNRKQIAEVTGVSPDHITRVTSTMIWRGKSVFAQVRTPIDGRFYMLNPAIFRRADDVTYDNTTRDIFGI